MFERVELYLLTTEELLSLLRAFGLCIVGFDPDEPVTPAVRDALVTSVMIAQKLRQNRDN
jgi:hypothetical protein